MYILGFAACTALIVNSSTIGTDKVSRLLVLDTMVNTLVPIKKHYDELCLTL